MDSPVLHGLTHPVWASALLRDQHDRVLIVARTWEDDSVWCLPGDLLPGSASPGPALQQILWELLSVEVVATAVLAVAFERPVLPGTRVYREPGMHLVLDCVRVEAETIEAIARPRDPDQVQDWLWASRHHLTRLLYPNHAARARLALDAGEGLPLLEQPHRRREQVTLAGRDRLGAGGGSRVGRQPPTHSASARASPCPASRTWRRTHRSRRRACASAR